MLAVDTSSHKTPGSCLSYLWGSTYGSEVTLCCSSETFALKNITIFSHLSPDSREGKKKKRTAVSPLPWWRRHLLSVILYHWCSERCLHSQKSARFLFVAPCLVVEAWSIFGCRLRRCIYLLNYHVCYMAWGSVRVIMHSAQSQSLGDHRHESQSAPLPQPEICSNTIYRDSAG